MKKVTKTPNKYGLRTVLLSGALGFLIGRGRTPRADFKTWEPFKGVVMAIVVLLFFMVISKIISHFTGY
jgi:hypothetical protein